ncbi:MAG: hypothetical protein IBJ18_05890 [Phycisphaerales bacterium]|nr:hypothetical protein [Phycisphaerales bacterium]
MKNKLSIAAILAVTGLAASAAQAQFSPTIPNLTVTDTIQTVDLNGAAIPAGTYRSYSLFIDWATGVGDAFSDEALPALTSTAADITGAFGAGNVFHSDPGVFFPSIASADPQTGMKVISNMDVNYEGGNPLFFANLQTFGDSTASWSNINLTLNTTVLPTPTADVNRTITVPAVGSPFTTVTDTVNIDTSSRVRWIKITIPAGGISGANNRFLDIDTETSTLAPTNDTVLVLFNGTTGATVAADDDDGSGLLSQLSFGAAVPTRPAVGTGAVYNGRDGALAAGDFYLAVANTGDDEFTPFTRFYEGFSVFADGGNTGTANVRFTTGTVSAITPIDCTGATSEVEPNNTKATAQVITLSSGQAICGDSINATAAEFDYFKVAGTAPAAGQIILNRIQYTSSTPTHVVTIRGLSQATTGINAGTDVTALTATGATTTPPRFIQWYTLGNDTSPDARQVFVRVSGATTSTTRYRLDYSSSVVTPVESGVSIPAGDVTVTTVGSTTTDTDFWVYDQNLNPVAGFGEDDESDVIAQGTVTKPLTAGTYYVAISNFNLQNNQPSPAEDGFRIGNVQDFPGVVLNTSTTATSDLTLLIGPGGGTLTPVVTAKSSAFDVKFVKFTVTGGATAGCNPADIACDNGDPLASNPGCTNSTTGPNEGDFNAFFAANGFFFQSGQGTGAIGGTCDIACDSGDPLATNPGCTNNGVNEGDYNCFFNNLFLPCI